MERSDAMFQQEDSAVCRAFVGRWSDLRQSCVIHSQLQFPESSTSVSDPSRNIFLDELGHSIIFNFV